MVTEAHRCEQLAKGCYAAFPRRELNPQPIDRKFRQLTVTPLHYWRWVHNFVQFEMKHCHVMYCKRELQLEYILRKFYVSVEFCATAQLYDLTSI